MKSTPEEAANLLLLECGHTVECIRNYRGDYERAQDLETDMHRKVLLALSLSSERSAHLLIPVAQKALESLQVNFVRIRL